MNFAVVVADLVEKPHNACFLDFARAFAGALQDLGHVTDQQWVPERQLIMFGANEPCFVPDDTIIYNAEPIALVDDPLKLIADHNRQRIIWDYSAVNVARWRKLGFERVVHCPVGYHPSMEVIRPAERETIDVLHYGALTPIRNEVLRALKARSLRVTQLHSTYGEERDAIIARSKVVLNMHCGDRGIFEVFRCSHLFANKRCVVAEIPGEDRALDDLAVRAAWGLTREKLVSSCAMLVEDARARERVAEQGYNEFKKIKLIDSVRKALAESGLDGTGEAA